MKNHIGKKLREMRLAKNYAQDAVAKDLGLSKTTLSEIENGKHNVSLDQLQRLAEYYGMDITEILPPPLALRDNLTIFSAKSNFQER